MFFKSCFVTTERQANKIEKEETIGYRDIQGGTESENPYLYPLSHILLSCLLCNYSAHFQIENNALLVYTSGEPTKLS